VTLANRCVKIINPIKFVRATRLLPSLSIKRLPFFFPVLHFFFVINILSFFLHFSRTPKTLSNPKRQNTVSIFITWERKAKSKTIIFSPREKMQRLKQQQQQQQVMMQQALMQQQSLYHPGLLAPPQVCSILLPFPCSIWVSRLFFPSSISLVFLSFLLYKVQD